ncbi:24432_t:CDS:2 [Dentiscutata erythropus]|uniref:24432_t:CDS:1 n=1 Tax=Dentiscutata erythropus TaxID=1348616 RepID=A0A9N8ZNS4_9GLOM|nr:24432_t:CDS:2 [Dentiscutata erythropus]
MCYVKALLKIANEDEFDFSKLCFASFIEPNMFDEPLNEQPQIIDKTNELTAPETEINEFTETNKFTDLENELYSLTKRQSFID